MTTEIVRTTNGTTKTEAIELALISGDLSKLTADERLSYYNKTCESLGLNPLTKPFAYIQLNGKLTLYALRDATDQLRKLHRVSIAIVARDRIEDVYVVTARASLPDGRVDESTGAVTLGNLKGDNLANALMKAETKAKRRVTLSIVGLGILDESELETVPSAKPMPQTRKLEAPPAVIEQPLALNSVRIDKSESQENMDFGYTKDGAMVIGEAVTNSSEPSPLDKWKERLETATSQAELDAVAQEVSTQADDETKAVVRKLYSAAKKRLKKEAQS